MIVIIKLGRVVKVHTEQLSEGVDVVAEALLSVIPVDLVITHTFGEWGTNEVIVIGVDASLTIHPLGAKGYRTVLIATAIGIAGKRGQVAGANLKEGIRLIVYCFVIFRDLRWDNWH